MKLITFAVPCYNSAAYMRRCIDSLLTAKDQDIEIIIVDDGSKDETGAIADQYEREHPGTVRAIHQENGGHGEGVNQGLRNATGFYYKVVDSDDWLDAVALRRVLAELRRLRDAGTPPDLCVCNYVRNRLEKNEYFVISFRHALPQERLFAWEDTGEFSRFSNLMMHALIYRTQLLRDCHLELPKHTWYVDYLFSNVPLYTVKTLYYIDVNLYQYLIGRADQSITKKTVIRNMDHLLRVIGSMIDAYLGEHEPVGPRLNRLLLDNLSGICMIATIHMTIAKTPEMSEKKVKLWEDIRRRDEGLYDELRRRRVDNLIIMNNAVSTIFTTAGYSLFNKFYMIN